MIERLIDWSLSRRIAVLVAAVVAACLALVSLRSLSVDLLPDLSDTQVIVRTSYPGQPPQVVEEQVTYPLTTALLSIPGVSAVRGYSMFGDSFIYVVFADGTDRYWARSRVLEYLSQTGTGLPPAAHPALGPDATGADWILEYALYDPSGTHDLSELRALQDWRLKYELRSVPGVAEVASLGGAVRQYQVVLDPQRLQALGVGAAEVVAAIRESNSTVGGGAVELGESEFMVRARGYLANSADFERIPVKMVPGHAPIWLRDVAQIGVGPAPRRGIAELDGQGEVVGGIVVMNAGSGVMNTVTAVTDRLAQISRSLPQGVRLQLTYNRSELIRKALGKLRGELLLECAVVIGVFLVFLAQVRSALVVALFLPLPVLAVLAIMRAQGIDANVMSLGGIAVAVGAMVDAAVVMVENCHRHLELAQGSAGAGPQRVQIVAAAMREVGPSLFASLLIAAVSFLPVLALQGQEGRLFSPLVFTKTYAMTAAALLSVLVVPALIGWLVPSRVRAEQDNPLMRALVWIYRPTLSWVLARPGLTICVGLLALATAAIPVMRLGHEFMPPVDEGDILYMPSTLPGIAPGKAAQLLQQTDKLIMRVPEVQSAFGKAGRADTATDPAPLEMIETVVRLKPRSEWRAGMTLQRVLAELDDTVRVAGVANLWTAPIRARTDMQSIGIKSPIGVRVSGPDLGVLDHLAEEVRQAAARDSGVSSAVTEHFDRGRYIDISVDREMAGRYGLSVADVHAVVAELVGGANVDELVADRARFPINIRASHADRDSVAALQSLLLTSRSGATVTLGDVARISEASGPEMIRSDDAQPSAWVYIDVRDADLAAVVRRLQQAVRTKVMLPPGYSVSFDGQYRYLLRAQQRLLWAVPGVIAMILLLLYWALRDIPEALLVLATVPAAAGAGLWLVYLLGYQVSVAVLVGLIALAGLAAEFATITLIYLKQAWARRLARGAAPGDRELIDAIVEGALLRVRPKAMTLAIIVSSLVPVTFTGAGGAEFMQRVAAPMLGGMLAAPLFTMLVLPAAFLLLHRRPQDQHPV